MRECVNYADALLTRRILYPYVRAACSIRVIHLSFSVLPVQSKEEENPTPTKRSGNNPIALVKQPT